ncbi:hypothetical protein PL373_14380 [Tenacibaculum maritimum]|nr:hypothetical protein [Tenacibaculum maritimum]MDB0602305.1 hypothetical protein [Tenacibaculum maritimum]MDB0612441.1 hypothetical protein [Tenacibaculum maritimum]
MKKIILLFVIGLISLNTFSQKLVTKTDEFTGVKTTETKVEKLISKGMIASSVLKYSFLKLNDTIYFNARMELNGGKTVFAIGKDFRIIFILEDKTKITIKSKDHIVSKQGGARDGFYGSALYGVKSKYYFENEEDIQKLKNTLIKKARVYTDEGYFEKNVKAKAGINFKENLNLILSK